MQLLHQKSQTGKRNISTSRSDYLHYSSTANDASRTYWNLHTRHETWAHCCSGISVMYQEPPEGLGPQSNKALHSSFKRVSIKWFFRKHFTYITFYNEIRMSFTLALCNYLRVITHAYAKYYELLGLLCLYCVLFIWDSTEEVCSFSAG